MATLATLLVKLVGDISGFSESMGKAEDVAAKAGDSLASKLGGGLATVGKAAAGAALDGAPVAAEFSAEYSASASLKSSHSPRRSAKVCFGSATSATASSASIRTSPALLKRVRDTACVIPAASFPVCP